MHQRHLCHVQFTITSFYKLMMVAWCLIISLFASQAANAGQWQVTYQTKGSIQRDSGIPTPWSTDPSVYINSDGAVEYWGNHLIRGLPKASITNIGTITATFTWVPTNGDAPIGTTLSVHEKALANAIYEAGYSSSADGPLTGTVDDGFGDSPVPISPYDDFLNGLTSSGEHLTNFPIVSSNGQFTVTLPARTFLATGSVTCSENGGFSSHNYVHADVRYSADVVVPKSILILRPENNAPNVEGDKYTLDSNGEWQGSGDSRFDNSEFLPGGTQMPDTSGYGDEDWIANLLGSPWPPDYSIYSDVDTNGDWSRFWHWYAEGGTSTGLGSDEGNTYDIHTFTPHIRPHVDWPYSSSATTGGASTYLPHDLLEEMESPNAPQPQTVRVNLHLTDTDLTNQHPEYNFDHHTNFFVTYHNEHELIAEGPSTFVTSADIPWQLAIGPNGQPISQAAYATPIQGWSPQLQYYVESNWQANINFVSWAGFSAGQNTGNGTTISVPPATIPANSIGVVYYRPHKVRIPFTYRHYLPAGREIQGYDAQGSEKPFSSSVDRSPLGFGTYPVDYIIFTFNNNVNPIPPTISHDPTP